MNGEEVSAQSWGETPDGRALTLYTLRNQGRLEAHITDYGGVLVRLLVPDRQGRLEDVVLGHDEASPYFDLDTSPYLGATIGRFGNRIAGGEFTLDGQAFHLTRNNGPNALHGGEGGFHRRVWTGRPHLTPDGPALELSYLSPDGEEGYPGNLAVRVTYILTHGDTLQVDYEATTDAPTILNLTNHTYWNLGGADRDILGHELTVWADHFTPVDATLIPTGERRAVAGTPFDFREARLLGERVDAPDEQLHHAGGYDHNFVLRGKMGELNPAAILHDPLSGRRLTVRTTEPGMQLYSGNFLDGSIVGKGGTRYGHRWGMCLETQHFPDSPHHPQFPSTVLRPGEVFRSRTEYAFTVSPRPTASLPGGQPTDD